MQLLNRRLAVKCTIVLIALFVLYPAFSHAQTAGDSTQTTTPGTTPGQETATPTLSNNGIFGCLGAGAQVANVGTTRAIGGVYVPVNDAAVTLNTGFLVYKECILDGMARKIAESGTTELLRQELDKFNSGRNGDTQYVASIERELRERRTAIVVDMLSADSLGQMCGAFRRPISSAIARGFLQGINSPNQVYACPFSTSGGGGGFYNQWFQATSPSGNVFGAAALVSERIASEFTRDEQNIRQMWDWGRGVVPIFDSTDPRTQRVVTPGFLIADSVSQGITSGYRQLENATEIDQVVANLFAGLTTRIIGSSTGIPGLFTSTGNQPAYIDRMVAQTAAAVRAGAVNAAVNILAAAQQTESAYLEAKQGIATALIGSIQQLRGMERQCWELIIPAVQTHAQQNGNPTLNIATSTQFSQAVIDANIRDIASTTAAEVTTSQQALMRINQLITDVTNSASTASQQQALVQLDQMVANGQLHSSDDAQAAANQRSAITTSLTTLVENTRVAWGDSQDPNIGWCNVNNTAVVERWFNAWRQ